MDASALTNQAFFLEGLARAKQACLLLHGLGGGPYELELLGRHLHRQGWTVRCSPYPGHDRPTAIMPPSTWRQWYAHVQEAYRELRQTSGSIHVIGFSTGCPLALHLAAAAPVCSLVLLCPYLAVRRRWYYGLRPEAYLHSIGRLVRYIPRLPPPIRDRAMRAAARKAEFFRIFNLAAVRSAGELIRIVKTELPSITAPTLLVQARHDRVVDPAGAEFLSQHLGSSLKQLVWLDHSDHIITLDRERDVVFDRVAAFLRSVEE